MCFISLKCKRTVREVWHQVLRQSWPKPQQDPTFLAHVTSRAFTLLQKFPRDPQYPRHDIPHIIKSPQQGTRLRRKTHRSEISRVISPRPNQKPQATPRTRPSRCQGLVEVKVVTFWPVDGQTCRGTEEKLHQHEEVIFFQEPSLVFPASLQQGVENLTPVVIFRKTLLLSLS